MIHKVLHTTGKTEVVTETGSWKRNERTSPKLTHTPQCVRHGPYSRAFGPYRLAAVRSELGLQSRAGAPEQSWGSRGELGLRS